MPAADPGSGNGFVQSLCTESPGYSITAVQPHCVAVAGRAVRHIVLLTSKSQQTAVCSQNINDLETRFPAEVEF